MLAQGFWPDGDVRPGRRRRGARPAAGAPGAVVHAVVRRRRYGALGRCSACPRRTRCTGSTCPAGASSGRPCWCRSCCRPWWSAWPSGSCSGRAGRWGSSASTRPPSAIVAGLVFFNVAVVIRAVGAAWESLDPRPGAGRGDARARPRGRCCATVTLPALRPAIVSAASVVFLFCATAFGIVLTLGGVGTPPSRPRSTCSPRACSTCRPRRPCPSCSWWSWSACCGLTQRLRAVPGPERRARRRPAPAGPGRGDLPGCCRDRAAARLSSRRRSSPWSAGSLRVDGGWSLANYRALGTTGEQQALLVPVTDALVDLAAHGRGRDLDGPVHGAAGRPDRDPAVPVPRRAAGSAGGWTASSCCRSGVSAVTLGFGFLITLDEPPLDLRDSPAAGARSRRPWWRCRWSCARSSRCSPASTTGSGRRPRRWAPRRCAPLLTVDLPVVWKPLLAASGFAFAVSLGEFGATSFLARDEHPTLPVVIFRLLGHPGELNYGMALAASVVLAGDHGAGGAGRRAAPRAVRGSVLMAPDAQPATTSPCPTTACRPSSTSPSTCADGEVLAVLGPSGCGKSTLLRAVAGLEPLAGGSVAWDGADLAGVPTHKRGFALMFQDGQLFPHLTVARNVGYALRLRRGPGHRGPGRGAAASWSVSRGTPTACPRRCPAASGSGSPWPGRWPSSRGCCCSTSRSRRSTPDSASGWPASCARSCARPAPPR